MTPSSGSLALGSSWGNKCLVFKSSSLLNGKSEQPSHISWWEEATHRISHHRLPVPLSRVLMEHTLPQNLPLLSWIIWKSLPVFVGLRYLDKKWEQKGIPGLTLLLEILNLPNLWVLGTMAYSSCSCNFVENNFKIFSLWAPLASY